MRSPLAIWLAYGFDTMPLSSNFRYPGDGSLMSQGLHIANRFAICKVCSPGNDAPARVRETANMGKPRQKVEQRHNYLRVWREFRKMTQEQLADLVGTNKSVISLLENSERGLSDKWARRLAAALKTSPGFLLDHGPLKEFGSCSVAG